MKIHLVSGFLGSGKTTGIKTACRVLMSEGYTVGVITNDQGIRLVDAGYFESVSIPNRQVVNGCFCCNYNALDTSIQSLIEDIKPDIIFAESVGSCTDIVATVMKPLQQYRNDVEVTISTFANALLLKMLYADGRQLFQDEVKYIYQKQLEEASVIVVTKVDLISIKDLCRVQLALQKQYPQKTIIYVNGTNTDSIHKWLNRLEQQNNNILSSLSINYDIYGAGEAALAWLAEELEVCSNERAAEDAAALANIIYQKISENELPIGHLKFLIDGTYKISYTATPQKQIPAEISPSSSSQLLVNVRIQTSPETLEQLIYTALGEAEETRSCKITVHNLSSFQPWYPKPTHRIAD